MNDTEILDWLENHVLSLKYTEDNTAITFVYIDDKTNEPKLAFGESIREFVNEANYGYEEKDDDLFHH